MAQKLEWGIGIGSLYSEITPFILASHCLGDVYFASFGIIGTGVVVVVVIQITKEVVISFPYKFPNSSRNFEAIGHF